MKKQLTKLALTSLLGATFLLPVANAADYVIDNSEAWTTTRKAVLVLAEQLEDHYL